MCSIDIEGGFKNWLIDSETLKQLYPLLHETYEVGGKFTFPTSSKTGKIHRRTSTKKIHKMNGEKDSVQAPLGILNFHTHPLSCYIGENTVWGWASGEDIRETLIFSLKGSLAHVIIAVEGVYILQINPCIVNLFANMGEYIEKNTLSQIPKKFLQEILSEYIEDLTSMNSDEFIKYLGNKKINFSDKKELARFFKEIRMGNTHIVSEILADIFRGVIVSLVEIYFRSSHRFRNYDINKKKNISPQDFIKFVNLFELGNIFNHKKKVNGCGPHLKCNGIPIYSNGKTTANSFRKYIKEYEVDTGFYIVDSHGNTLNMSFPISEILKIIPYVQKLSNNYITCTSWFELQLTPNYIYLPDSNKYEIYNNLGTETKHKLLRYYYANWKKYPQPLIIPSNHSYFKYYSLTGNCSYVDIQKFHKKIPKKLDITIVGSRKCPYTNKTEKLLKSRNVVYKTQYYPSIEEAISISGKKTIPAIYNFGKYIGGYRDLEIMFSNTT